jgi:hypothetical protein
MSYLQSEMKLRDERMEQLIRSAMKKRLAIRNLSERLDLAIGICERLADLEVRVSCH